MEIVFIAGMPHSGSTFLETFISGSDRCIGLGEVFQYVDRRNPIVNYLHRYRCSCGESVEECPFWSQVTAQLNKIPRSHELARYEAIFEIFSDYFGGSFISVDSSKVPLALEIITKSKKVDLKVIHLLRDFRAWHSSTKNSYQRNGADALYQCYNKYGFFRGLAKYSIRKTSLFSYSWLYHNRLIEKILYRNKIFTMKMSHEELCFDTYNAKKKMDEVVGVSRPDYGKSINGLVKSNHSVFGNRMINDSFKLSSIVYDDRWTNKKAWKFPYHCLPDIKKYNNKIISHPPILNDLNIANHGVDSERANK
jgi:hypothetical protein